MLNIEIVKEAGRRARLFAFGTKAPAKAQEKTVSTLVIDVKTEVDQEAIDALEAQLERIAALQEQINDNQAPYKEGLFDWLPSKEQHDKVRGQMYKQKPEPRVKNPHPMSIVNEIDWEAVLTSPEAKQVVLDAMNRPPTKP